MKLVMSVADRIVVLNFGQKIAEGTPEQIQRDPAVVAAYLGTSAEEAADGAGHARPAGAAPHRHVHRSAGTALRRAVRQGRSRHERRRSRRRRPGRHARSGTCCSTSTTSRSATARSRAIKGISFDVGEGEIVALLGANGAGKTTTQKTVSGMLRPAAGSITFDGQRIDGIPPHELINLGICHVPGGPARLPADDGARRTWRWARSASGRPTRTCSTRCSTCSRGSRSGSRSRRGTLSGGEQQMLAIGRALMGKPRLLLLDEPSMGLAPLIVEQIFEIVREINANGVTVLLVEQNAAQALTLADRGYVLETGEIVLSGTGPGTAGRRPDPRRLPGRGARQLTAGVHQTSIACRYRVRRAVSDGRARPGAVCAHRREGGSRVRIRCRGRGSSRATARARRTCSAVLALVRQHRLDAHAEGVLTGQTPGARGRAASARLLADPDHRVVLAVLPGATPRRPGDEVPVGLAVLGLDPLSVGARRSRR